MGGAAWAWLGEALKEEYRDRGGLSLSREAELFTAVGRNHTGADMMPVSRAARPLVHVQVDSSEPTEKQNGAYWTTWEPLPSVIDD